MTYSIKEQFTWSRKMKALVVSMLALAMLAASLLAPAPVQAAFPGANGKIAFASDRSKGAGVNNPEGDLEIFTMNPDGTGLKQLTKNKVTDASPAYSSDGKKIVFHGLRNGNFEILKMNSDGTGKANLTKNPASDLRPSFSPSGKKVLFDSTRNGIINADVFIMSADGTGQTALTSDPRRDVDATFSPDGSKIAFVSDRGFRGSDVFVMNANGTQQTNLTLANDVSDEDPSFSPDGSKIAFASNRDGANNFDDFDVFVMNAKDGSETIRLTGSTAKDNLPSFSPDGRKVAFVSTRDGGDSDVFVMTASGATQVELTLNTTSDTTPDWQPIAATFTVTSASDFGDGVCDATCTLREAIGTSNKTPGPGANTIRFDIPGSGVQTITPVSTLPAITQPVTIDGYTQPGASPNTLANGTNAKLMIELNGSNIGGSSSDGIAISSSSNSVIKGLAINRFPGEGIQADFTAKNVTIEGNFVGTDPSGTINRGNGGDGMEIDAPDSTVGGSTPDKRNLISGNDLDGLSITQANNVRVEGNLIGTKKDGVGNLGNGFNGVDVSSNATGIRILRNAISFNGQLGIDLEADGRTTNDAGDVDAGANRLQNFPVLSSAKTSSTKTTIVGRLNSTPGKTFKVQLFSNPSGNEGKKFLGQVNLTTEASGRVSFTKALPKVAVGKTITATATGPGGNTSEFSAARKVAAS